MAATRKLQGEIDRCLKKVTEGVETFEDIWQKVHNATNSNQKEKYEADLKKEIKKLQRLRDQIKSWIASGEIKDKTTLMDNRKLIETQMERFKVVERETKTKAYSKEGLGAAQKLDPAQKERDEIQHWLVGSIGLLNIQTDAFESEIESLLANKKKKMDKDKQERIDELKGRLERHRFHIRKLETLLRMLDNMSVEVSQIRRIKDDVEYYIESSQEPDFEDNEFIYDDIIGLDELEMSGVGLPSSATTDSNETAGTPTSIISGSSPIPSPALSGVQPYTNHSSDSSNEVDKKAIFKDVPKPVKPTAIRATINNTNPLLNYNSATIGSSGTTTASSTICNTTSSSSSSSTTITHTNNNGSQKSSIICSTPSKITSSRESSSPAPLINTTSTISGNFAAAVAAITTSTSNSSCNLNTGSGLKPTSSNGEVATSSVITNNSQHGINALTATAQISTSMASSYNQSSSAVTGNTMISGTVSNALHLTPQKLFINNTPMPLSSIVEHSVNNNVSPEMVSRNSSTRTSPLLNSHYGTGGGGGGSGGGGVVGGISSNAVVLPASLSSSIVSATITPSSDIHHLMNGPTTPTTITTTTNIENHLPHQHLQHNVHPLDYHMDGISLKTMAQQVIDRAGLVDGIGLDGTVVSATKCGVNKGQLREMSEAHIPPLLGVAPLGTVPLQKEHQAQFQLMEASYYHMPHPSDSERVRSYLPRNPYQTPSYYIQTPLPHSDTVEFYQRLTNETLFFVFYYMEGTKAQYLAAKALKKQSWRFHTKYMMWFQRHEEPKIINEDYEQGTYIYFDYEKWGQRKKEGFTFEYKYLEDRDLN